MKESLDDILLSLIDTGSEQDKVLWLVDESLLSLYQKLQLRQDSSHTSSHITSHLTVLTNRYIEQAANRTTSPNTSTSTRSSSSAASNTPTSNTSKLIINDFDFSSLPRFHRIVYRISKEKPLVHHCINHALDHLNDDGELILIGEKQDGIKSIAKNATNTLGIEGDVKKNGSLYLAHLSPAKRLGAATQAGGKLPTQDYTQLRPVTVEGIQFYTKPGIFGWEKIDKGSTLLLQELPRLEKHMKQISSILDLGCGWGYLMCGTKHIDASRRVATDNNAAAIDAARLNTEHAGIQAEVLLDDCGEHIREKFDLILCNPPFHQGFSVDNSLLEKFLKNASRMSRRSTRCLFVVNQFIPLDTLADQYFSEVQLLNQQDGFKVWQLRH